MEEGEEVVESVSCGKCGWREGILECAFVKWNSERGETLIPVCGGGKGVASGTPLLD